MLVYDAHCHLESIPIPPMQFGMALVSATTLNNITALVQLRNLAPDYKIGFGLHPWYVDKADVSDYASRLEQAIVTHRPDFIGETGLDYLKPNQELQQQICDTQIKLAKQYNLPLILHCVHAYNDLIAILKQHKITRGIIHGFNAGRETALTLTDMGFMLSIGSLVTRNTKIASCIGEIPLDKIVFESDAPFMPAWGKETSASADTFLYAQLVARKLNLNLIDLINQANYNLKSLFISYG